MKFLLQKQTAYQAIKLNPPPSTKESQESQRSINIFHSKICWVTPFSKNSLFTSRSYFSKNITLVDAREYNNKLCDPLSNQWILDYNLDYSDPNLLSEDPSQDGFTNLEKWLGNDPYKNPGKTSFDPNDPKSRPLLWTKLRCESKNLHTKKYYCYFIGIDTDDSSNTFLIEFRPSILECSSKEKNTPSFRVIHLQMGEKIEDTPLQLVNFKKESIIYREIEYDISKITLINTQTQEEWIIFKKTRLHPSPTSIELLDNISLEYTLDVPSKKINLQCGDLFLLESRALNNNDTHKDKEWYKLLRVNRNEVLIEGAGDQYTIPVL